MGYMENCCAVRYRLDDSELLCQLAEESVELAAAAEKFVNDGHYMHGEHITIDVFMENMVEEMADVKLVAFVMLDEKDMAAAAKHGEMDYLAEIAVDAKPYAEMLWKQCMALSKAALKMRRTLDQKNPTPTTPEAAKYNLLMNLGLVLKKIERLTEEIGEKEKVQETMIRKAERWAERLENAGHYAEGAKENKQCDWCEAEHEVCATCIKIIDYYEDGGSDRCSEVAEQEKCDYYKPMKYCPKCGKRLVVSK